MNTKVTTKAIVDYMSYSSPLNQAFVVEALGRDNIEFTYQKNETNIVKVKQAIKLYGIERVFNAIFEYANLCWVGRKGLLKSMEGSFISGEAWVQCAREAVEAFDPIRAWVFLQSTLYWSYAK